jgi:hypothetical protein
MRLHHREEAPCSGENAAQVRGAPDVNSGTVGFRQTWRRAVNERVYAMLSDEWKA